ncbi:MAG: diaminopimelate epimerase [Sinobacterium sp.]|nr:diaminopimelate epimerase [Sinobacterium sp.]
MFLKFSKMHGIGNDFIVIDAVSQRFHVDATQLKRLADRHFGIGCDQILVVEPPQYPQNDFRYRIFNADGGEVENCGNGARCFARFVRNQGLIGKDVIRVETAGGDIVLYIEGDNVRVDMGKPILAPAKVPFTVYNNDQKVSYPLAVDGAVIDVGAVSMGNPHCIQLVNDVDTADVEKIGPLIEAHEQFPNKVNVGFMQIISREQIRLRVFERGAGETLACGTGACAAVVHGIQLGLLDASVSVSLPGGDLHIEWLGGTNSVQLTGPAEWVFEGKIKL